MWLYSPWPGIASPQKMQTDKHDCIREVWSGQTLNVGQKGSIWLVRTTLDRNEPSSYLISNILSHACGQEMWSHVPSWAFVPLTIFFLGCVFKTSSVQQDSKVGARLSIASAWRVTGIIWLPRAFLSVVTWFGVLIELDPSTPTDVGMYCKPVVY